jgi:4-hydroxybenzoate polyprenyltransferase
MKQIGAFLQLIRWPNLVFIVLTQLLFYFCVYIPLFNTAEYLKLFHLVIASVFIAAAGYIINDYFDLNIDQINKPGKNVFSKNVSRRWAILLHFILSLLGLIFTFLALGISKWYLILANAGCILLLWFYSASLKKRFLIGNVAISMLTAWTVLIIFFAFTDPAQAIDTQNTSLIKYFRVAFLYAGFAFIISLVREAVKDMEDLEGDLRYGCRTLPIVSGIRATKMYAIVWLVVLIASVAVLLLYVLLIGWWGAVAYLIVLVLLPSIHITRKLIKAADAAAFAHISKLTKWVMLTGILSMVFFRIYFSNE